MEIALIENIQRESLNPIEEAMAYHSLIQEYDLKHEEVAENVFEVTYSNGTVVRVDYNQKSYVVK